MKTNLKMFTDDMVSNITKYPKINFLNPVMNVWVKQGHWIQSHKIDTQK